jgi:FixJ family two-component response regulator
MREGTFDLLTKPVDKEKLIDTLKSALSHGLEN